MTNEVSAKGIIVSVSPQGEFGRRINLITDTFGKITAFSFGGAKMTSRIIGSARPFVNGEFILTKGKSAWNLHEIKVIDGFSELSFDTDICFYAFYILEVSEYFSAEGMPEDEAKSLLNLIYVTLCALRDTLDKERKSIFSPRLIRRIFELRLLKMEGEYTLKPELDENKEVRALWTYALSSSLSNLYKYPETLDEKSASEFEKDVTRLFKRQVQRNFNSEKLLT